MARPIQDDDGELVERLAFCPGDGIQVVTHRFGDVDRTARLGTHRNLVHVDERTGVQHRTAFGNGDDTQGIAASQRRECGSVDRVDCNVGDGLVAVADMFAIEQHRRFVLFALADDDDSIHVDGLQEIAHGVNGGTIGCMLVAAANPFGRRKCRRLGHPNEFHRQVAVRFVGEGHRPQITPSASH